jgi:hypothetical protein
MRCTKPRRGAGKESPWTARTDTGRCRRPQQRSVGACVNRDAGAGNAGSPWCRPPGRQGTGPPSDAHALACDSNRGRQSPGVGSGSGNSKSFMRRRRWSDAGDSPFRKLPPKTLCRGSFSVVSCMLPVHPHTHLGSAHHAPGNTLHQRLDPARTPHRGRVPVRPPCTGGCFSVPAKLRQIKHLQRNRGPTHYRGKAQPARLRKSRPETSHAQACERGSTRASGTRSASARTCGRTGRAAGAPPAGR